MKSKLVLLLIAAVGSTALVASAQTPTHMSSRPTGRPRGRMSSSRSRSRCRRSRRAPARRPHSRRSPPMRGMRLYGSRPQDFSFSVEENNLAHQAEQFAQQLAAARSDSDREKIKSQLTDLLEKQFDQRQKKHEDEIKQLEAQIKKLKDRSTSGRRTAARSSAPA